MSRCSLLVVSAAVAALAAPALAGAAPTATRGIVVQRDAHAGALVLSTHGGNLKRISLKRPGRFAMGAIVAVSGTKVSIVGHTHRAKLRGVVVRRARGTYALAGNGSVLAVASATPPLAGQQVTATVQVGANALSDDDGQVQVEDSHAPMAELRGTVLSQTASALVLTVEGFPAGLSVGLGGQAVAPLAVGTEVEAKVALGADPATGAIVLTLVSLHVESGGQGDHGDHHGSFVKAEGQVTNVVEAGAAGGAAGSITVAGEHGDVTFVIPAGFGATGVAMGDTVEARGTAPAALGDNPTLVRLESAGEDGGGDHSGDQNGDQQDSQSGDGGSGGEH